MRAVFRRMLSLVRRASRWLREVLVVGLLAAVYVVVLPWFALGQRVFGDRRSRGWRLRDDRDVGNIERLRQPF